MSKIKLLKNKKTVSDVISTTIIIGMVIIAAGFLFIVARNLIEIKLSPVEDCIGEPRLKIENACYNHETEDLEIILSRRIGTNITEINFIIEFEKDSSLFFCSDSCENCEILKTGTKTYFMQLKEMPKKITIRTDYCLEGAKTITSC